MNILKTTSLVLAGCLFAASANATVYTYNSNTAGNFSNNPSAPGYDSISASYDDSTSQFSWEVDYSAPGAEGFWLVISDGENPKSNVNEYTMYYGDYNSGNLAAYVYNGQNGPWAYLNNPFIGDYSAAMGGNGSDIFNFSLDATAMNGMNFGADWDGTQFADNIGIWFHPIFDMDASFNNDGSVDSLSYSNAYWYDTHMDGDCGTGDRGCVTATASVPEPTTMALMGLGLLGLGASRKKKLFK